MTSENSNDNSDRVIQTDGPDAHGHAAILLVESLIHGLVARQVISVSDAVEIVDIAAEVKADIAADRGDSPAAMQRSAALLGAISKSFALDSQGK